MNLKFQPYDVFVTYPCSKCNGHNFLTSFEPRICGIINEKTGEFCGGEVKASIEVIKDLILKAILEEKVRWQTSAIDHRAFINDRRKLGKNIL